MRGPQCEVSPLEAFLGRAASEASSRDRSPIWPLAKAGRSCLFTFRRVINGTRAACKLLNRIRSFGSDRLKNWNQDRIRGLIRDKRVRISEGIRCALSSWRVCRSVCECVSIFIRGLCNEHPKECGAASLCRWFSFSLSAVRLESAHR